MLRFLATTALYLFCFIKSSNAIPDPEAIANKYIANERIANEGKDIKNLKTGSNGVKEYFKFRLSEQRKNERGGKYTTIKRGYKTPLRKQSTFFEKEIDNNKQLVDLEVQKKNLIILSLASRTEVSTEVNDVISPGVIVLGMHRSGTSMLAGLLVIGLGYKTGGPLIAKSFDNKKGFFERIDIVEQNNDFLGHQEASWDNNVYNYDYKKSLEQKNSGVIEFNHGEPGLKFLNDPKNAPYLQKDPRMCITLKTWLNIIDTNAPAILFTYRHPLEVAESLRTRAKIEGQNRSLSTGFQLWIVYNMRAVQNSQGQCRILTSNNAILANPKQEVQRISNELTSKCHVKSPPNLVLSQDIDLFVDTKLQVEDHTSNTTLMKYGESNNCIIYDYPSEYTDKDSNEYKKESDLYIKAMKIYCDFQSHQAYEDDYKWPSLE